MRIEYVEMGELVKQYGFKIIPKCQAAKEAGYTDKNRSQCQLYSGPAMDEDNIYYCAYFGNPLLGSVLSSILVCLRKSDGSLVYAVNCQNYNLDTGETYMGKSKMICRPIPIIKGNRLYLVSSWLTNIGPQLFCVDKRTGNLIYAIAYNLPNEVEREYGVKQIILKRDYSKFIGSNSRICNLEPVVIGDRIYVASASYQNAYNPGTTNPEGIHYSGYIFNTDQGSITYIKEMCNTAIVKRRILSCAPEFRIGDVLNKNHPSKNPFMPGKNNILISTITKGKIINPGAISGEYNFAQKIDLQPTLVVDPTRLAPFWRSIGKTIYITAPNATTSIGPFIFDEVLAKLSSVTIGGIYTINTTIRDIGTVKDSEASGDFAVWYIKEMKEGDAVSNKFDANGLGYWGNDSWGGSPAINVSGIFYGTGQSHGAPVSERLYFAKPHRNYRKLKIPLVDLSNQYTDNHNICVLELLNNEKIDFNNKMRKLANLDVRSPRGQMSYSDAIMCIPYKLDNLLFGVRTIPCDIYNFFGTLDPLALLKEPKIDVDGDLSSGIYISQCLISAPAKHGGLATIDISQWDRRKRWEHSTPESVGIRYKSSVYTGPNDNLGGSNYSSTFSDINTPTILALTSNTEIGGSCLGSDDRPEQFVSTLGLAVPKTSSIAYAFNMSCQKVIWDTPLHGHAFGSTTVYNSSLLTNDLSGFLYSLKITDGTINWVINSGNDSTPMMGGISSPQVDKILSKIYWIASYSPPFIPGAGKYGWVLIPKSVRDLDYIK